MGPASLVLENRLLELVVGADGGVRLLDRAGATTWRLAPGQPFCRSVDAWNERRPMKFVAATQRGSSIEVDYAIPEGRVRYEWHLEADHVAVRMTADVAPAVELVSMPGAVQVDGGVRALAVPVGQGLLIRPRGSPWEQRDCHHGGHDFLSLGMTALLAAGGALLEVPDSPCNWLASFGEDDDGLFAFFQQHRCPVEGWPDACVRLYPVRPDVTAICRRYRALLKERGRFVSWEEKIARKPIVKELFGALIAFVGYNRCDGIDYVGSARRLKACGFDSIFFSSTRMCHYSLDFTMGGDEPIWLSDADLAGITAIDGCHVAPWGWVYEGLDDGSGRMRSIFRHDTSGPWAHWSMDGRTWYRVCTPYQIEHIRQRFATDMRTMDWIHFDVSAMFAGFPCHAAHAAHGGVPMGRRDDMAWVQKLFSTETVGNRVVSSEGFTEHFATHYDIGSTKLMPNWKAGWAVPVPMTMLALHDSCIHDWWEIRNYNARDAAADPSQSPTDAIHGAALNGAGFPQLKAAMDALYGCPPNLFPFGRQYGWLDVAARKTYAYTVSLDDPAVRTAIAAALPVARLHRRIGMLDLESFEMLSPDGAVQATAFSDGTRIVANLSPEPREAPGVGPMAGHAWIEQR